MKCVDCKFYHEVAYKWGECLHYPCMAEPSDPACNEFEEKVYTMDQCDKILAELLVEFFKTGQVPLVENDTTGYINGNLETRCEYILMRYFCVLWPAIERIVYLRTSKFNFETFKEEKL